MKRFLILVVLLAFSATSWAFDSAYSGSQVDAEVARGIGRNITVGDPGSDAELVTEQAVREAFDDLGSAATRTAEDTMTDGSNLPDGHAIKTYGDSNWGGAGSDDWDGTTIVSPGSASSARTTLELGSAALRTAEDTLTNGSNLPDGAAIKTYGDANWGGGGGLQYVYDASDYSGTDRAKIQSAIDAAQTNNGVVYIPGGTWTVDDHDSDNHCLEIIAGLTIIACGHPNTIIRSADNNASIFYINTTEAVHMSNMLIENTAASPTTGAHGITVTSSTDNRHSTFDNLDLKNNDYGIALLNATFSKVTHCRFASSNSYGLLINNGYNVDSGSHYIAGNLFTGDPTSQIRIESGGGSRIIGNNIWAGNYGIDVSVRNGTVTSVLVVSANKFEGQDTNSIILRNYAGGTTGKYGKIVISSNEFCEDCGSSTSTGISINGYDNNTFSRINISGNVMEGGGIDVGKCTHIAINNNVIHKSSVSRSYGINFTAVPAGNTVMGGNLFSSGFTADTGGTAAPDFPCGRVKIQDVSPGFWLDETGTGNKGAYVVLDSKIFQVQRRAQGFGAYETSPFTLNIETGNASFPNGTVSASCGTLTCDYVFEKDYNLMSLDDLQKFIKTKKSLPKMTINEGGVHSMKALREELVEKVEEQALYILQLHERLKKLEERLDK